MELLLIVTSRDAGALLAPLAEACGRRRIDWVAFFTDEGVLTLRDPQVQRALRSARQSIACQDSWNHYLPAEGCPVELGSQTDNSALIASVTRIVSL